MGIYTKAGKEVYERIGELIDGFHSDLAECQLRVQVLFAHPARGRVEKPPLTSGGYPVAGIIKLFNAEDRAGGAADVKIRLDSQAWENYTEVEQTSLLDRLLYRLEVRRDKKTKVIVTDDGGRPVLRLRRYDYFICGYNSIIRRYGREAVDAGDIEELSLHYHTLLPVASPQDVSPVVAARS